MLRQAKGHQLKMDISSQLFRTIRLDKNHTRCPRTLNGRSWTSMMLLRFEIDKEMVSIYSLKI